MTGMTDLLIVAQANNDVGNNVWDGWGSVILVAGSTLVVLIITGVIIWQVLRTYQIRSANAGDIAREEAYRRLAEEMVSVQKRTVAELDQLTEGIADLRARTASIERVLSEVE